MPDDTLDERLRAVERALTGEDRELPDLSDAAELNREVESLTARLDAVEERLDRLDGATQALRGYVGNVRAVNESVERKADAALAKAETLESEHRESGDRRDSAGAPDERRNGRGPCKCAARRPVGTDDESDVPNDGSAAADCESVESDGESAAERLCGRVRKSIAGLLTGSSESH